MRRLLPLPGAESVDLDDAYWVSDPGHQHVRAVMVASADGAAQADGRSGGLSEQADRTLFGALRAHAEVILVGATTARAERYRGVRLPEPRLAWRQAHGIASVPAIAVVTQGAGLDLAGPLFADTLARPIVVTQSGVPARLCAQLGEVADLIVAGDGQVDIARALDALAERGLRRVSCEGGPRLLAHVAAAGRLDELCLTVSPVLLAGPATRILVGGVLDPPRELALAQVLEDHGSLFLRYCRA